MKGMFKRALAGVAATALAVTGLALGAGSANAAGTVVNDPATFTFEAMSAEQFVGRDSLTYYKLADYVAYTSDDDTVYGVQTPTEPEGLAETIRQALTTAGVQGVPGTGDPMAWAAQQGALDSDQSVDSPWAAGTTRKFANALAEVLPDGQTVQLAETGVDTQRAVTLPAGVYLFVDDNPAAGGTSPAMAMIVYSGTVEGDKLTDPVEGANKIDLKNEVTPFEKTVDPGVPGIGDTKTYTITGKVPNWIGKDLDDSKTVYTVTDTPSKGQSVNFDSITVKVNGTEVKQYGLSGTKGFVDPKGTISADGESTFTINLTDYMKTAAVDADLIGTKVEITYTTVINEEALANPVTNSAEVNNAGATREDSTEGDTVQRPATLTFTKTEADGETPLPGAQFSVTRNGNALKVREKTVDTAGAYVVDPNGTATVTSGADGKVTIEGLGDGKYVVTETFVPKDFMQSFKPSFTVTVTANGTDISYKFDDSADGWDLVTGGEDASDIVVRNIRNVTQLPLTGAAGTALFTVLGLLIAGAGGLAYMKSRNVKHALRG